MLKIGIILGSTRPNRKSPGVAKWVYDCASKRSDATFDIIDIKEYNLPLFDEPLPPSMDQYSQPHTKAWAEKIAMYDGFIFVTPEYDHSIPGALKNAIDFLFKEWTNKSAGMVSYGSMGGVRAAEHLRTILSGMGLGVVRTQVMLSVFTDFENMTTFKPAEKHEKSISAMMNEVVVLGSAYRQIRK